MDLAALLIYFVILVQVVLVVTTFYLYMGNRLRLFLYIGLGFLALLIMSILQVMLPGTDTGLYTNLLQAGAGLLFLSGILSAV